MSKDSMIRVRFEQTELDRAKKIADRTGLSLSDIVRHAITDFIGRAEREGVLSIPLERAWVVAEGDQPAEKMPARSGSIAYPKGKKK